MNHLYDSINPSNNNSTNSPTLSDNSLKDNNSFTNSGHAIKTYKGVYEEGAAEYHYYEDNEGNRVFHGKFIYNDQYSKYTINAFFNNGMADSIWTLIGKYDDYGVGKATGKFKNGNRVGVWVYESTYNQIKPSISRYEKEKTVHTKYLKCSFKNNQIDGEMDYKSIDYYYNQNGKYSKYETFLKGIFKDGYASGEWTSKEIEYDIIYTTISKYNAGKLINSSTRESTKGEEIGRRCKIFCDEVWDKYAEKPEILFFETFFGLDFEGINKIDNYPVSDCY